MQRGGLLRWGWRVVLAGCLALSSASNATALPSLVARHPKLSEALRQRLNVDALQPGKAGAPARRDDGLRTVLVRFRRLLTEEDAKAWAQRGVTLDQVNGRLAHVDRVYGARLSIDQLRVLLNHADVERVFGSPRLDLHPEAPSFGHAHTWTHASQAWPVRDTQGTRLRGAGVLLCDLDSAVDIFHPLFFRADAGRFPWLDVDGNQVFDPGVDAVDLNANGTAEPDEVLRLVGGGVVDAMGQVDNTEAFTPGRHWLYADTNNNGQRDVGPGAGFTEQTPAFGEPLLVVDDVDGDGVLQPDEKLLRLGTSKFRGVYRPASGIAYERGTNLIDLPVTTDAGHATGVAGILVGGLPGHTLVQGVAPDADLLVIVQDGTQDEPNMTPERWEQSIIAGIQWARDLGTDIFVHEYGSPVGEFGDGSGEWERMLDGLTEQGSVQATAAHNFAGNRGRARILLQPGQSTNVEFTVTDYSSVGYVLSNLYGNFRWSGAAGDITGTIQSPSGTTHAINTDGYVNSELVYGSARQSPRGTGMAEFIFGKLNAQETAYVPLPDGRYVLTLENHAQEAREVSIYVTDETMYAWAVDLALDHDDRASMAHPSTADSAVVVGAFHVNEFSWGGTEGDLASYSGRGPRIDGLTTVTLTAPADHYTAVPTALAGAGHFSTFGGTSGALPQVAGAIALLLQKEPTLTPAQVRDSLRAAAARDAKTGPDANDNWGAGRLDVARMLLGDDAINTPPTLHIDAPAQVGLPPKQTVRATLDASASTDAEDARDALVFRFDVDDDGTFEQDAAQATFDLQLETVGRRVVMVEVEDRGGMVARRLVHVEAVEAPAPREPTGNFPAPPSCAAGPGAPWAALALLMVLRRRKR